MKKCLLILSILLFSCTNQNQRSGKTPTIPTNNTSTNANNTAKPLIIGGKQYHYPVFDFSARKALTINDIDDIENLVLIINPFDSYGINNLDGIEQLFEAKKIKKIWIFVENLDRVDLSLLEQFKDITELDISLNGNGNVLPDFTSFKSLRRLGIHDMVFEDFYTLKVPTGLSGLTLSGKNLHKVDLSIIESLHELTGLRIEGDITKLPNLTKLEKLRGITIDNGELASLEGIGAPNIRRITLNGVRKIDSLAPLNNLPYLEDLTINGGGAMTLRIADMSNLPCFKKLILLMESTQINLQGIENLSALEELRISTVDSFNIEGIGKLKNLRELGLKLISPEPSLEFLRNMPNLSGLALISEKYESDQVLDVSPLATLRNLRRLSCIRFIIKNISALDVLDALSIQDDESLGIIYLYGSRLYNKTDKSKHTLVLEWPTRE